MRDGKIIFQADCFFKLLFCRRPVFLDRIERSKFIMQLTVSACLCYSLLHLAKSALRLPRSLQ